MLELLGHLHPVLVHLPIGILLIAVVLRLLSGPRYPGLEPAVRLTLGLGVFSAVASCITGYLLSLSGDYDKGLVQTHLWFAVSVTLVSAAWYFWEVRGPGSPGKPGNAGRPASSGKPGRRLFPLTVFILLLITGHFGGSLTHGPGYLLAGLQQDNFQPELRAIPNVDTANVYTDLVRPVLHDNCYRCHSEGRQKGGLRLDGPAWILKGGKHGKDVLPGRSASSELMKRLLLPLDDDHHMAPNGKPQLSREEIALLGWWIDQGAPVDAKVGQLARDSAMQRVFLAFHQGTAGPVSALADAGPLNVADSDLTLRPVIAARDTILSKLRAGGALVLPIAQGSNYLEVRFINDSVVGPEVLALLPLLKDQLVVLKCSSTSIGDSALATIGRCTNLVRLWLDHTQVTGKTLGSLQPLSQLRYLNLTATRVGAEDLLTLKGLPRLAEVYLYKTAVDRHEWAALQRAFPHTRLDSGGYSIPFLAADTEIVRAPPAKK